MSGLALNVGGGLRARAGAGGAGSSAQAPPTITAAAYGPAVTSNGGKTPAFGAIGVGVVCLAALAYLWWSLPR